MVEWVKGNQRKEVGKEINIYTRCARAFAFLVEKWITRILVMEVSSVLSIPYAIVNKSRPVVGPHGPN